MTRSFPVVLPAVVLSALTFASAASARPMASLPPSPAALSLWALAPVETVGAPVDPWISVESWSTSQPVAPVLTPEIATRRRSLEDGDEAEVDGDDSDGLDEAGPPVFLHADTVAWLRATMGAAGAAGGGGSAFSAPSAFDIAMPDLETGCELSLDAVPALHMFDDDAWTGAPWPHIEKHAHTLKDGTYDEYDQIARRWDRPEAYASYRYPVPIVWVASGYDLDKPDDEQRRGKHLSAIGHGGIDLAGKKGTEIRVLALEHQIGDAEVLYVGHLFGTTVVTRHTLREGGKKRDYILIFGHLDGAAENVWRGRKLRAGELLGYVGNTDSPDFTHLHLEARRMRDGVDAWKVHADALDAREVSVVCDPRNVLPLRVPRRTRKHCSPALLPERAREWFRPLTLTLDPTASTDD